MLIAKKLFNFHYCYTGRKNLTIQQITEEFKYHDKKNYILFSIKRKQNKTANFQKPTNHTTAVGAKTMLTTYVLQIFYLNSNSAKRTSKCLSESFIFSV